jgi:membrane protein DedA with SNARE-associated domain
MTSLHDFLRQAGDTAIHLGTWGYVILAVLVMIEGPVATLVGAGAASAGLLNPVSVFVSAAIGNLTGDVLWYSLGRLGKTEWLLRHGRWLGLTKASIDLMEGRVRANARKIIFIAKLTLVFTIPALVATGISRVRLRKWLPVDMIAEGIWTGALVAGGYYASGYILRLEHGLRLILMIASPLLFLISLTLIKRFGTSWGGRPAPDEKASEEAALSQATEDQLPAARQ